MYEHETQTNIFERTESQRPRTSWQTWLIGHPLSTADAAHETIGKLVGLAVFSSDALSSVAYGPQELMAVLVLAGMGVLPNALPLAISIVALLAILTFSYEQTIHTYPNGGGAYIVARDNLGELPAQVAGAALLMDYILTVAVSISSGVAQIISAVPILEPWKVVIAVALILLVMTINLRGVRESGVAFAIPTYFFLIMMYLTVGIGLFRFFTGALGVVADPPEAHFNVIQPLTAFLILRAFANGTTSLTGVEAISNGITAFKEPRSKNAGQTLMWMSAILGSLLLGVVFLFLHVQAIPSETETMISQLARTVYGGRGFLYLATITGTTVILAMAANTAFAGFPRLAALAAEDGYLPRQMTFLGSRLVYSYGIVILAVIACVLVIFFQASVSALIPLYAIGVFLSFTLSQGGMALRWWKSGRLQPGQTLQERGSVVRPDAGWRHKMVINAFGALCTLVVMFIFAIFKFTEGAWIILLVIPALVVIFFSIHRHYQGLARQLSLENHQGPAPLRHNRVIMPVGGVHRGTLEALRYAATLSDDVTAVHISINPEEARKIKAKWEVWGEGTRLVILNSPYRTFLEPLLRYIDEVDTSSIPGHRITIVVPQFVPKRGLANFLHTRTAETLRRVLLNRSNIVITEVPYQVE
jgi:amino acid transporter